MVGFEPAGPSVCVMCIAKTAMPRATRPAAYRIIPEAYTAGMSKAQRPFPIASVFQPAGDQPNAIAQFVAGFSEGKDASAAWCLGDGDDVHDSQRDRATGSPSCAWNDASKPRGPHGPFDPAGCGLPGHACEEASLAKRVTDPDLIRTVRLLRPTVCLEGRSLSR